MFCNLITESKWIDEVWICQRKRSGGIGADATIPTSPYPIRGIEEIGNRVCAGLANPIKGDFKSNITSEIIGIPEIDYPFSFGVFGRA